MSSPLNLKSISIGKKSKIFSTDQGVFIADIQPIDEMISTFPNSELNQFNFYDLDNKNIIHNIYPITDLLIKSYHYAKQQSQLDGTLNDYIETFIPQIDYNHLCQHNNFAFILSECSKNSYTTFNTSTPILDDFPRIIYPKILQSLEANTYVYPTSSTIDEYGLSLSALVPLYNLSGVEYNYFAELPLDLNYIYSKDGQALGEAIMTKNTYDVFYNMNTAVVSTASDEVSASLNDCRTYNKIGSTGDTLYLTYHINTSYESESVSSNILPGQEPLSAQFINQIPVTIKQSNNYYPNELDISNSSETRINGQYLFDSIYNEKPFYKQNLYSYDIFSIEISGTGLTDIDTTYEQIGEMEWESPSATIYAALSSEILDVWLIEGIDTLSGEVLYWAERNSEEETYPSKTATWNLISPIGASLPTLDFTPPSGFDEIQLKWNNTNDQWEIISLSGTPSLSTSAEYYINEADSYLPPKTEWTDISGNDLSLSISYNSSYKNYENVETVKSLNRFNSVSGRKSNLYSINIQNSGLNIANISDNTRENIKKSINNIIRDMTKIIAPINTQLFNVYWTGE